LQELLKRNIPGFEKERLDLELQTQSYDSRFKQLEQAISHVNDTMIGIVTKLDE
jgi:hypothetical protein